MSEKVLMYSKYERFWHWAQAALIMFLILTGFEVHGTYTVFGVDKAVTYHQNASYLFIILSAFTIFWHFTTGEWRQYVPTRKFLKEYIIYYTSGIFKGAPHPTHKVRLQKLNPLQRLTYLSLKVFIIPVQVVTGLIYLYYPELSRAGSITFGLEITAWLHTLMAFFFIAFLIVHVYLTSTGAKITTNVKAMITGYEDVE